MYAIQKKHITQPKFSVDGKKHTRTLYFAGEHDNGNFVHVRWSIRSEAHFFIYKKDAVAMCNKHGGTVVEVK